MLPAVWSIQSWIAFALQSNCTRVCLEADRDHLETIQVIQVILVCTWVWMLGSHLAKGITWSGENAPGFDSNRLNIIHGKARYMNWLYMSLLYCVAWIMNVAWIFIIPVSIYLLASSKRISLYSEAAGTV